MYKKSLVLLGCLSCAIGVALPKKTQSLTPLARKLQAIVNAHPKLKRRLRYNLQQRKKTSYWYHKNLADFYRFFSQWQYQPPKVSTLSVNNSRFADFADTLPGFRITLTPVFRSWFLDFEDARLAYLDSPASLKYIQGFLHDPKMHLNQYQVPKGGFKSFNQFFTRKLKPGMRKIYYRNTGCVLDSPVDGQYARDYSVLPGFNRHNYVNVKGDIMDVREVFNDVPAASQFLQGGALTFWLEYYNTHWYHAPISGKIIAQGVIAGLYGKEYKNKDLPSKKRSYLIIKTKHFGLVGVVMVGLQTVSKIILDTHVGEQVTKGQRLGHFSYGGSTAVLFFQKGVALPAFPIYHKYASFLLGQPVLVSQDKACAKFAKKYQFFLKQ